MSDALPSPSAPAGEPRLTDAQIQWAVFAVLRRWKDDRAWDRYTRETGPYDATSLRPEVLEIIRAVLDAAAFAGEAGKDSGSGHSASSADQSRTGEAPSDVGGLRQGNWPHPDGGRIVGWRIMPDDVERMKADAFVLPREVADCLARLLAGVQGGSMTWGPTGLVGAQKPNDLTSSPVSPIPAPKEGA